jgi:hypothetical protein
MLRNGISPVLGSTAIRVASLHAGCSETLPVEMDEETDSRQGEGRNLIEVYRDVCLEDPPIVASGRPEVVDLGDRVIESKSKPVGPSQFETPHNFRLDRCRQSCNSGAMA